MNENLGILKKITEELLELMGVSVSVETQFKTDEDLFEVNIEGGDSTGLLIGKKGETLSSLQTILGIMLKSKLGDWKRVVVNVGDYKQKEEDYLKSLAQSAAQRVVESGGDQNLYNLKSWQRRVIHLYLKDTYPDLLSESIGEGDDRCLVIKSKS